jgi:hypothetical protein
MTYLKQMELGHEVGHNVQVVTALEEAEYQFYKQVDIEGQPKNWSGYGKGVNGVSKKVWISIYVMALQSKYVQAERMYSEQDMKLAWEDGRDGNSVIGNFPFTKTVFTHRSFTEWFEQHKNK